MNEETTIAIEADPNDPEDFPVSQAGLERGLMGRRIRMLRNRLGLSQAEFARAYLTVIDKEPEAAARALEKAAYVEMGRVPEKRDLPHLSSSARGPA